MGFGFLLLRLGAASHPRRARGLEFARREAEFHRGSAARPAFRSGDDVGAAVGLLERSLRMVPGR